MEATKMDDGIEVVSNPPEPESTEPIATGTEPALVVGTEPEGTEPESTGTEVVPTGTEVVEATGTGGEPTGKTDEVPKMLGDMVDQVKKLHDRFGYLQRQVETIRQEPVKPAKPEKPKPSEKPRPKEEDFEKYDEYIDAVTDWKVDRKLEAQDKETKEKEVDGRTAEAEKEFKGKLDEAREKYTDFDEVAMGVNVPISQSMVQILHETENPGDIAYYLGQNLKECAAISHMTPFQAAKAIGKIEAEVKTELEKNPSLVVKPEKKVTKAPAPIKPIGSREVVTKDPEKMTQAEYEAWRRGE